MEIFKFGDIFSIQEHGKEVIGFTEEDIIYLHDKYRQASKKPCVDDLEEKIKKQKDYITELEEENCKYEDEIEGLEGLLKLKDWEINELEEKYEKLVSWALRAKQENEELTQDNKELVTKFNFLKDALNDWKEMCKKLKGENYDR